MAASGNGTRVARIALTIGLAIYGLVCLLTPGTYRLLDSVDLAIHESGHIFFGPFGEFIGFLGGTLMQLIVPIAFMVYFMRQRDMHAASVGLWWVAQNLWNISVYVADAQSQLLPLVGGGVHDWTYMLGTLMILHHDQVIASSIRSVGGLIFVLSIAWGVLAVLSRKPAPGQQEPLPLDTPVAPPMP